MPQAFLKIAALLSISFFTTAPACFADRAAKAEIVNAAGESLGVINIYENEKGVSFEADLHHVPVGAHAIHIHEKALASPTDFASAGGHFNPTKKQHGGMNPKGYHLGDLPNFKTDSKGNAAFAFRNRGSLTLEKGRRKSLLKKGGTSIIIHEGVDDFETDPSGGAGARIAGGTVVAAETPKKAPAEVKE